MKNYYIVLISIIASITLSGCSDVVEIPPAHYAKLSTPSGLQEGIIPPSRVRLSNFCFTCDNIVMVEASDHPIKERLKIFMPKDKLNLIVDVRGIVSVNKSNINTIFDRLTAKHINSRTSLISINTIYTTYGRNPLREVVRTILSDYTIDELLSNRNRVSREIFKKVRAETKTSPMSFSRLGLTDIQPPKVIIAAQEAAKEREIAIKKAESQKAIDLHRAQARLELAKKQQEIDLTEAETQKLVNIKLAEGVTEAFIAQRSLRVLEMLSKSKNKVIVISTDVLKNPSMMIGISQETFNNR